jgi:hypothetical protein
METIPYRNTKLSIKIVPKGTLLFRVTETQENDTRGVLLENGTRCITPNFNVFFFANPFIWKMALEKWIQKKDQTVYIYILKNDIKVLNLISPSKYSRMTKNKKGTFIKKCSTVKKGCMPKEMNPYDPCMSKTLVEKFPDVVGMLAVSFLDGLRTSRYIQRHKTSRNIKKYIKFAEDSDKLHSAPPELILHPLKKRPSKSMIVNDNDKLENNYELLESMKYNDDKLLKWMDIHSTYDPNTYFFTFRK